MAELNVPQVDFSSLGQLPALYKQGQADALRQQTLANLGQGGQADAAALLKSGDLSLAQLGINLKNTEYQHGRDATLDARHAKEYADDLALRRAAAARASEDKFAIKEVTDPNTGATTLVRVKTTGPEGAISTGVSPSTPNNPFSAGGKFNGDQGKAAGFTDRMLQSEGILSGVGPDSGIGPASPGVQGAGTSVTQAGLSKIPGVGNFAISEERQKYNQAKADFINAQLRRESGAAIGKSEFDNADKQYFPVPGDSPDVLKQKASNRRAAIEAMGREGGPSYKPKLNYGESGLVPYGQPAAAPAVSPQPSSPPPPKTGQLVDGYRFKGGNPADPASWVKSQ